MKKMIVAISGASGAIYGLTLLKRLRQIEGIQTHLIVSSAGQLTLRHELQLEFDELTAFADQVHDSTNVGATIASGSFRCDGMVIAPCSMRSLAAVAHGLSDNLLTRAADVMLKQRRSLILMVRETPLNLAHLRNMIAVTEMGGVIFPPVPSFYHAPANLNEMVYQTIDRVLELLGLDIDNPHPWRGLEIAGP